MGYVAKKCLWIWWMGSRYIWIYWRFHQNYDEDKDVKYIIEVDIKYLEWLGVPQNFSWKMKIGKSEKLVCNLNDKKDYVIHTQKLKQALNHSLAFVKVHWEIKFQQEAWLK